MKALIEKSTGNVLMSGEIDFASQTYYDAAKHEVKDDVPETLKPFDPHNDSNYSRWNGSEYVEVAFTEQDHYDDTHVSDEHGIILKDQENGKIYKYISKNGVLVATEIG